MQLFHRPPQGVKGGDPVGAADPRLAVEVLVLSRIEPELFHRSLNLGGRLPLGFVLLHLYQDIVGLDAPGDSAGPVSTFFDLVSAELGVTSHVPQLRVGAALEAQNLRGVHP